MDDHKSQSEEEKAVSFSTEDFSASGESNADPSNVKKKKKFRPAKLMSRLKIKRGEKRTDKSYSEETPQSDSATSASSAKMSSPKLSNLVKRLSGKKSYKVSPIQELETTNDAIQEFRKLSHSTPNVSGDYNDLNAVAMLEDFKSQPLLLDTNKPSDDNIDQSSKELSTENKKVQLKITISGKVNSASGSAANNNTKEKKESPIDKASPLLHQRADIILPASTTQVRVSTVRDKFFNVLVPSSKKKTANTVQSISDVVSTIQSTTSVVKEGHSETVVKESEVEKYLVLTSSLNSIISAAQHLDDMSRESFPELKIRESLEELDSDEMSKNLKSKIPVSKRKSSDNAEHPTVHTQEAHRPNQLSLSKSTEKLGENSELKSSEIKFEVGTPVRPLRVIQAGNNFSPLIITETDPPSSNLPLQDSSDEVFHSPKSDASMPMGDKLTSSTRRKIAYIPQLTIYTPEEQELLKSNIIANSDSFDIPSMPSMTESSIFPHFDEVGNMSQPEKREHLYKILVIGELGTGKTSFIKRYVHQFFSQNYRATIGVDFALKVLNWDQSTIIRLQLWDIAGQERFGNMTRVYFKEAVGAFIVFDVSRTATFDAVSKWKQDLDSKVQLPDGNPIPCILLANKCDLPKQGLVTMPAKMDEYCKQNNFAGWFETSAKENTNIEESAKALVSKILLNDKLIHNDMVDERLVLDAEDVSKKKFCSC